MTGLIMLAGLGTLAGLGASAASGDGVERREVSKEQYATLLGQCRYADTQSAREQCRTNVRETYRIGRTDRELDCRTYSGVTVCGTLTLGTSERACVQDSVSKGLTHRRAEVECYVYE
ncbi:hypothetical protein AB0L05_36715 [Nonomuraea pusilla]|uniref:hypothetical protein n=1 Tax=Nonomuraea pusilla TaxID=46177 RepID=UPI0033333DEE